MELLNRLGLPAMVAFIVLTAAFFLMGIGSIASAGVFSSLAVTGAESSGEIPLVQEQTENTPQSSTTIDDTRCGGEGRFLLGVIPSWDRGLGDCEDITIDQVFNENKLGILINNIITIAVTLSAVIAAVFVIVGGFKYTLAMGNADKTTGARKTIINALIGLVIAVAGRMLTEVIFNHLTRT